MKINKDYVLRNVGGENIVVPVGEASKRFHGMITLNDTGAFLWAFFSEEHTEREAVAALLKEYEVTEETAACGVRTFVESLEKNGFLA